MTDSQPTQEQLIAHFASRLAFETDPSDVHKDLENSVRFVFLDVRGEAAWNQGHAVGATHMHHSEILERAPKEIPLDMPVVVYCWGPGCNGAQRAALHLARLGYRVKEMIGGFEYWAREGYRVEGSSGRIPRAIDPLTNTVDSISCDC